MTRRPWRSPPTSGRTDQRRSTPSATGLAGGWFGKKPLRAWFDALQDQVAEVDVDGERVYALAEDVDELASTRATKAVRLLPGFDQYVLGPGSGDGRVVPASRRAEVSRQAGWISPVVVVGGVVRGTWEVDDDQARVTWFAEGGKPPRRALYTEVARVGTILERARQPTIDIA